MNKRTGILISVIGILSLLLVTLGISFSIFNYIKEGNNENSVKVGDITFKYTEGKEIGNGILIKEALPSSDEGGKVQAGEGKVFDFKI